MATGAPAAALARAASAAFYARPRPAQAGAYRIGQDPRRATPDGDCYPPRMSDPAPDAAPNSGPISASDAAPGSSPDAPADGPGLSPQQVEQRLERVIELLAPMVAEPALLSEISPELRKRFYMSAGQLSRPSKASLRAIARANRRANKARLRDEDQALLDRTGIRQLRENPVFQTPRKRDPQAASPLDLESERAAAEADRGPRRLPEGGSSEREAGPAGPGEVHKPRACYVCQREYTTVHHFYDQLCCECGDFNYAKRSQTADLRGRVALVTGGRVKIGYQAAILMLRAGAHVVVTTRFPRDASQRFAREQDAADWSDRLEIHGIDLRHIPSVEALCARLCQSLPRLDFIINNACQTVRRPPGFYDHLMAGERGALALPDEATRLLAPVHGAVTRDAGGLWASAAELSQVPLLAEDHTSGQDVFPLGHYDADLQQVDLRKINSWRLQMAEVPTIELLEVHLVNAVAPFLLNARLKPLMLQVPTRDKHIVNVSAMEGQFYRSLKSSRHPHTNMAKASLNMMTRTAALDYIEDGIHMNSVDTGWVTDEDPAHHAEAKREMHNFHPPLDIVDGAARICDPILDGINTQDHVWGQFLKDYKPTDW